MEYSFFLFTCIFTRYKWNENRNISRNPLQWECSFRKKVNPFCFCLLRFRCIKPKTICNFFHFQMRTPYDLISIYPLLFCHCDVWFLQFLCFLSFLETSWKTWSQNSKQDSTWSKEFSRRWKMDGKTEKRTNGSAKKEKQLVISLFI